MSNSHFSENFKTRAILDLRTGQKLTGLERENTLKEEYAELMELIYIIYKAF